MTLGYTPRMVGEERKRTRQHSSRSFGGLEISLFVRDEMQEFCPTEAAFATGAKIAL